MSAQGLRRGLLIPGIFALAAFALFLALGTWQIERKGWKDNLIATLAQRLNAPPQELPPVASWFTLDKTEYEFRRVKLRAQFIPPKEPAQRNQESRVYTSGLGVRDDIKGPGYFAFARARLPDGTIVVINRGFVPSAERPGLGTQPQPLPEGPVEVTGIMRWPEIRGWFVPAYDGYNDVWFARTHLEMASQKFWESSAPFYIEQEEPAPTGGIPQPGRPKVDMPNNHLQYAMTWYGLAAVVVVFFAVFVRSRKRA